MPGKYRVSDMGTRLYPCTNDPAVLARLAGVSQEAPEILKVLRAAERALAERPDESLEDVDIGYAFYQLTSEHEVGRFESFQLFGWGKFDLSLLPSDQRVCGHTHDPVLMRKLLASATNAPAFLDLAIELSEGFYWS